MDLDSPARFSDCQARILAKPSLRAFYEDIYRRYKLVATAPDLPSGLLVEIGSGAGFAKEIVPNLITTDILDYPGVDKVIDGRDMPFESGSVACFFLANCLHHISDAESFFSEVDRCLAPGGVALIIDQHHGWISRWVLQFGHHEPYNPDAAEWRFESTGPLSGANGALSWIIFQRDIERFKQHFPKLNLVSYSPMAPLFYWLSGGLKRWTLVPTIGIPLFRRFDNFLLSLHRNWGSFVEIKLKKSLS